MKLYQTPVMNSESIECIHAVGQYIFEFTPEACPGLTTGFQNYEGQEGGFELCFEGSPVLPGNFTAEIHCQNIEGTFTVHVGSGDAVSEDCFFLPFTSISPELPSDCIVETFIVEGNIDECNLT
jgi:hypothetical protein